MTSRKTTYQIRQERGQCRDCGSPDIDDRIRCAKCRQRNAETHMKRRAARKAAGECVICGKRPPSDGVLQCGECTERIIRQRRKGGWRPWQCMDAKRKANADAKREERKRRAKLGVCIKCGDHMAMKSRKHCHVCLGREPDPVEVVKAPWWMFADGLVKNCPE